MFLLIACLGMVVFLTTFVVPRMSDLFAGFGNSLPTHHGDRSGDFRLDDAQRTCGSVPVLIVSSVLLVIWSRTPGGRLVIDRTILSITVDR